ncbi:MAG: hypothetical protein HUJ76_09750 [Parasporobacterium sp.]|nr:hypothetical protein [Parasporobacterium sp.]
MAGLTFTVDLTVDSPCRTDDNKAFAGIDESKPRRISDVKVAGKTIDPEATYNVAGNNSLLIDCLDGYTMFKDCKVVHDAFCPDVQMMINYFEKNGGTVSDDYSDPYGQERMKVKE